MPLTIATLNNEAAVAKTFTEISKDRTNAEWLNSTDSTASLDCRIIVKQQLTGKTITGIPIRRSLVQAKITAPTTVVLNGTSKNISEEITVNLTVTGPTALATLTPTQRKDLVAYIRNLCNGSFVDQLAQGQV